MFLKLILIGAKVRNMFCIFITIHIFAFLLSENIVSF